MATEIIMPELSQTTDEVHLIDWYVKEGDRVKKGDYLCEVETDKVTTEVESFAEGIILKILVGPDTTVKAGTVIAIVGSPGEKVEVIEGGVEAKGAEEREAAKGEKEEIEAKEKGEEAYKGAEKQGIEPEGYDFSGIRATSIVKNVARKKKIDLKEVKGTGPGGLITIEDVNNYETLLKAGKKESGIRIGQKVELSERELEVARNLSESSQSIPSYIVTVGIWMDRILKLREKLSRESGEKPSFNSFFIYALARSIKEYPRFNGYYGNGSLIVRPSINIGFAVSHKAELYVPVVKEADKKDIETIDEEVKRLVKQIKEGSINLSDLTEGNATISNLGMYEVDSFTAIIPPKQSCIIAVGRMQKALYIDEMENMRIRERCNVTGSFDHRIINGAEAGEFLGYMKRIIEEEL